jgi:SAM-dependent methyltransferase
MSQRVKPGPLLDFGCNFGQFLVIAREDGWWPSGFEPFAKAAEQARTKGFEVHCGWSLQETRLNEGHFAAITATDVFYYVKDPFVTLRTFHRLLKPGGVLAMRLTNKRFVLGVVRAFSTKGPLRDGRISRILQAQFNSISLTSLSRILRRVGFDQIRIQPHATTAPWDALEWKSRIAYFGADALYVLSLSKINVSPGVLLFGEKPLHSGDRA